MTPAEAMTDLFERCSTRQQLVDASYYIWKLRGLEGVRNQGATSWRRKWNSIAVPEKIVAVDLPGIVFASFKASGPKETPRTTRNVLARIYRETTPDRLFVCTDSANITKRQSSVYKKGREPKPEHFEEARDATHRLLQRRGLKIQQSDGHEADDLLATIAFIASLSGQKCTLVTEDKDMWQCLGSNHVVIYAPKSREYRGSTWLTSNYGIQPKQYVDWISLVGGKNELPGAEGIGKKTASELLQAFGSVDGIMQNLSELREKQRESISRFYKEVYPIVKPLHELDRASTLNYDEATQARKPTTPPVSSMQSGAA